jgi:hypothetical protein
LLLREFDYLGAPGESQAKDNGQACPYFLEHRVNVSRPSANPSDQAGNHFNPAWAGSKVEFAWGCRASALADLPSRSVQSIVGLVVDEVT